MQTAPQKTSPAVALDEIERLVKTDLPPLPDMAENLVYGDFAKARLWLARAQHKEKPALAHPRIALFMAPYGVDFPVDETFETLKSLAQEANADLRVYDLGTETGDFDAALAAHALAYGMMAVQPGVDLVAVAALNPASQEAGLALQKELQAGCTPLEALVKYGNVDIAAIAGCMIAARLARIPVLTEGHGAAAAAALLEALQAGAAAHCCDVDNIVSKKTGLAAGAKSALVIPLLKALAGV